MDKFIKIEKFDKFRKREGYMAICVNHIMSFKVSEKKNKIELKMIDGSIHKFNFRYMSDLKGFEEELISKIDSKEKKKFDPDVTIEKQN